MNWNDWEAIWRRQETPVIAGADLATRKQSFEAKRRKMACGLFVRDVVEATAGLFVSVVFALQGWHMGPAGWPFVIVVALTLGVTGFFIKERIRTHRIRVRIDAPLLTKLEADIAELRHQRHLLLNVGKWYLGPLVAVMVIVLATIAFNAKPYQRDPYLLGFVIVLCAATTGFVWVINRRAVRKQIEPGLAQLEKLRRDLLAE